MQILGVWVAPAAPETPPNVLRLRRRTFGRVSGAARAAQTPKINMFQSSKKPCIKNPGVDTPLHLGKVPGPETPKPGLEGGRRPGWNRALGLGAQMSCATDMMQLPSYLEGQHIRGPGV